MKDYKKILRALLYESLPTEPATSELPEKGAPAPKWGPDNPNVVGASGKTYAEMMADAAKPKKRTITTSGGVIRALTPAEENAQTPGTYPTPTTPEEREVHELRVKMDQIALTGTNTEYGSQGDKAARSRAAYAVAQAVQAERERKRLTEPQAARVEAPKNKTGETPKKQDAPMSTATDGTPGDPTSDISFFGLIAGNPSGNPKNKTGETPKNR